MFARRLEDLAGTDKEMVRRDGDKVLHARRLLTKADGCGFSLPTCVSRRDSPSTCTTRTTWRGT